MARASKNTDKKLIKAGLALMALKGCSGIRMRAVAQKAKVNLGMFNYHFKNRDDFLRQVLQSYYEEFFEGFQIQTQQGSDTIETLKNTVLYAVKFVHSQHPFVGVLLKDVLSGEKIVIEFVLKNFPRHFVLFINLIKKAQEEGRIRNLPPYEVIFMLMSSVGLPVIFLQIIHNNPLNKYMNHLISGFATSEESLLRRLDVVLKGLAP